MTSRGSSGHNEGPPHHPVESRKAKKRRRNAEKKKEQYMQRLARLTNAPNLTPQYPPGITPLEAHSLDPFLFLPGFNPHLSLLNTDFQTQNNFFAQEGQQHAYHAWPTQQNSMPHFHNPLHTQPWAFQHHPQADPLPNLPALMSSTMTLDSPPMAPNLGAQSAPAKPPKPIGLPPDPDPNSKRGLFKIPDSAIDKDKKPYIPTPACTLVLERLPKAHKSPEYVKNWARSVCGSFPAKVIIDNASSKALVEFASSEEARKAWESPQLGVALKGLKPHQLKDKPREDLIQAYWYRVDGISAGVGELEEGEIEVSGQKRPEERPSKKQKRRLDRERRDREERARREVAPGPSRIAPAPQQGSGFGFNGLPQRPETFPPAPSHSHLPLPPLTVNGLPSANLLTPDGDDMEVSPYSPEGPVPFPGPSSSWNPQARPFVPSRIPLGPRAMMNVTFPESTYTGQNGGEANPHGFVQPPLPAAPPPSSSTEKMEADLRARVLKSRRLPKSDRLVPSPSSISDSPVVPELSPNTPQTPKEPLLSLQMEDAVSFITATLGVSVAAPPSKPPAPLRTNSSAQVQDLAEKRQRLEQDLAERKALMDQFSKGTKAEKDAALALLREKDRYARCPSPASAPIYGVYVCLLCL